MLIILGIILGILVILHRYCNRTYNYWRKRNVPFLPPITFFGNLIDSVLMKKSLGQIYTDAYNLYKDVPYLGMYKIRQPILLIRDPEIITDVLIKDFHSFERNDVILDEKADPIASKNPFFQYGPRWKTSRSQLSFCFTSGKMKHMFPLIHEVSKNMVKYIEREIKMNCNPMNAKELAGKFTTDSVATCAFGLEGKCFEDPNSEFRNVGRQAFEPTSSLSMKLLIIFLFPFCAKIFSIRFIPKHVEDYFSNIIRSTLKYRKENNIVRNDFLDVVTQMKFKPGEPSLTQEDITAHAVSFFGDGFETSSIVLSFTLYNLASNQNIQKHLRNEIQEVLKKHDGIMTYDAIQEMIYLDCVLSESMRLHSPALNLSKICTTEYTLPPCKNSTQRVTLEPNTPVIIPVYALHLDAKYFPNPEKFDPERFSESNKGNIIKGTYLPFGEGPRICPGSKFAVLQVKTAIVSIIRNFEVRVNKKTKEPIEIEPKFFMLLAKGGIWLDFCKINL